MVAPLMRMSTEAVMTVISPEEDDQSCRIEGCSRPAAYQVVKLDGASEQQKFFCQEHGVEYANRGHLVISENV